MKTLALDESGDDNLVRIDPHYPIFVLGGVILEDEYAQAYANEVMTAFKRDMFGRTDFVLHTAEIVRNAGVFAALLDRSFREEFYRRLNQLVRELDFSVIACAIRKDRLTRGSTTIFRDPYCDALERLIASFCRIIGNHGGGGRIRVERLQPAIDRRGLRRWRTLQQIGTAELSGRAVRRRITSLSFHEKSGRFVELELADLVVTPIGRHIIGRPDQPDWDVVRGKLHGGSEDAIELIA